MNSYGDENQIKSTLDLTSQNNFLLEYLLHRTPSIYCIVNLNLWTVQQYILGLKDPSWYHVMNDSGILLI